MHDRPYDDRVLLEDISAGPIVCYRVGTVEVSASRLGVLCRDEPRQSWRWGEIPADVESQRGRMMSLAWYQHAALDDGLGVLSVDVEDALDACGAPTWAMRSTCSPLPA